MLVLDVASEVLPPGIRFLEAGWWLIHVLAVVLVYNYAYRRGRRDGRRDPSDRVRAKPVQDSDSPPAA